MNRVLQAMVLQVANYDDSHDLKHAQTVARDAVAFALGDLKDETDFARTIRLVKMTLAASLTHDVPDHKYDKDGSNKALLMVELSKWFNMADAKLVLDVIDRISYSKENKARLKGEPLDWNDVLGEDGKMVREWVSAADKMDAIGIRGVERCLAYIKAKNPDYTEKQQVEHLVEHAKEKLIRLMTEFVTSPTARKLMEPLHIEMCNEINHLAKLHEIDGLSLMDRTKAIQYFKLAQCVATIFSKDPSTKVGAVFIAPESHQVLSLGYNGMPRKVNEKIKKRWERPLKYDLAEHAERNAIYNAARHGTPLDGCIAIVTLYPCNDCARGLIQCGAKEIITIKTIEAQKRWGDKWKNAEMMLDEANVNVTILTEKEINSEIDVTIDLDSLI
jgi:dCMP deaminase